MGSPLETLGLLATQEVEVTPALRHLEGFAPSGLLTILWHGEGGETGAVVACGGAMGGLLGPADGLYHDVGTALVGRGVATLRVGYRRPNDLAACVLDAAAAAQLAVAHGADHVVAMGHSFGGAVAVQLGALLPDVVAGVITLATQSAGCEVAEALYGRPLLLVHGDRDELLPPMCSEVVHGLAGGQGELVVVPGAGHLLTQAGDELRRRLPEWIVQVLESARNGPHRTAEVT
jgi:pimeloyl-ACP methyl ester carboxylesterase